MRKKNKNRINLKKNKLNKIILKQQRKRLVLNAKKYSIRIIKKKTNKTTR